MQHARLSPRGSDPLPPRFADRLAVFADLFTCPTWSHALVLLAGAILAPGRRTVTAVLRILGRERDGGFCTAARDDHAARLRIRFAHRPDRNCDRAILLWVEAEVATQRLDVAVEDQADGLGIPIDQPASPNCRR